MSFETRASAAFTRAGQEIKALKAKIGDTTTLVTTAKTVVGAINELAGSITAGAATIADGSTATTSTWSSSKINSAIQAAKDSILGGAGPAYDTLQELKALVDSAEESSQIDALTTVVGNKVDKADIGNTDVDLVGAFEVALL